MESRDTIGVGRVGVDPYVQISRGSRHAVNGHGVRTDNKEARIGPEERL